MRSFLKRRISSSSSVMAEGSTVFGGSRNAGSKLDRWGVGERTWGSTGRVIIKVKEGGGGGVGARAGAGAGQ